MEIKSEYVTLNVSDGTSMRAWVAAPKAGGAHPGILVFQEAFGVNAHIRDLAGRFAGEGYLAIAPELFHRTGPGFEGRYDDFPSAMIHMRGMTDTGMEADQRAAHDWLLANGAGDFRVSTAGYCMGGRAAFLAALTLPLACAISYYGGGIAPSPFNPGLLDRLKEVQAPVLFFWGGLDGFIKPEHVKMVTDGMRAANKPFASVDFSDADHGFFCDERASYQAAAATEAWPLTLAFLKNHTRKA